MFFRKLTWKNVICVRKWREKIELFIDGLIFLWQDLTTSKEVAWTIRNLKSSNLP